MVNCSVPPGQNLTQVNTTNFVISTQDSDGCSATGSFNPQDAEQQYGILPTTQGTCGFPTSVNSTVLPVAFWFFEFGASNNQDPIVKTVLCRPSIELFNVAATVNYNNGSLTNVIPLQNYTAANNISSFLNGGNALNG